MVGTIPAAGASANEVVAGLLKHRPTRHDPAPLRAEWLFAMADALTNAGLRDDAKHTRVQAMGLVRRAVREVAR